jgi:endoglucanase
MASDRDIHLYGGLWQNSGVSLHPLLQSNGGIREVDLLASPPTVAITGRTGTSQGLNINLAAINARPNHSYRIEITGRVDFRTGGTVSRSLFLTPFPEATSSSSAALGDSLIPDLRAGDSNVNNVFTASLVRTQAQIAAHLNGNPNAVYRLGGANAGTIDGAGAGHNIIITGVEIIGFCPTGCTFNCGPLFPGSTPVVHTPFRNISAQQLVSEIGIGWNLGNTLDSYNSSNPAAVWANGAGESLSSDALPASHRDYNNPTQIETIWQGLSSGAANQPVGGSRNFRVTQELISAVKAAGFNAIRIPVTWYKAMNNPAGNTAADFRIDPRWMDHVQSIVDMAVREDMYIILNTHHDDFIFRLETAAERQRAETAITETWRQISERFRDYNEKLIFAGLNEPKHRRNPWNVADGNADWNGSTYARQSVNILNQRFVNAVRASGGNNANRILMLPTYGAQASQSHLDAFQLPSEPSATAHHGTSKFVLSVHVYSPHNWAHDGVGSYNSATALTTIRSDLDRVANRAAALGIPVIMGEWGTLATHSTANRADHAFSFVDTATRYSTRAAAQGGPVTMRTFVWDTRRLNDDGSTNRSFFLIRSANRFPNSSGVMQNVGFVPTGSVTIINAMTRGRAGQSRP